MRATDVRMKILFVCDYFWPFIGGAEISSTITLSKLSEMGSDISIVTHRLPKMSPYQSYNNLRIYRERFFFRHWRVESLNAIQRFFFYLRAMILITKYVSKNKPDLILTQQLVAIPTTLIARLFQIPVIILVRDYWPICYYRSLLTPDSQICSTYDSCLSETSVCARSKIAIHLKKLKFFGTVLAIPCSILMCIHTAFAKYIIKRGNAIITVSDFMKNILVQNGFDPRKIKVIHNPIAPEIRDQCGSLDQRACSILFVGFLDFKKGLQVLIKAMPQVCAKLKKARLIVVGDGPQKTYFETLVRDLCIEAQTQFLGQISNDHLGGLYNSCSVVIVPSIWPEPFGRVVAEALSFGRPVIASDIGGMSELIDEKVGVLVPPGDLRALADAIVSVLTNEKAFEFESARERFAPEKIARQYNTLIQEVAKRNKKVGAKD